VPVFQAHGPRQIRLAGDEDRQGQPHLGQLSMLLEGIDWRRPERTALPLLAG